MSAEMEFFARFAAAAASGIGADAQESVEWIQQELNVPVVRDFAGNVIERSKPGEPPRKETGNLQANVGWAADVSDESVKTTIYSDRDGTPNVPAYLEQGTSNMAPRPFMQPGMNHTESAALPNTLEKLNAVT